MKVGNIHKALKELGVEIRGHYSDLYVKKTPETEKIISEYEFKDSVRTFRSQIDQETWYDIPLVNEDFLNFKIEAKKTK